MEAANDNMASHGNVPSNDNVPSRYSAPSANTDFVKARAAIGKGRTRANSDSLDIMHLYAEGRPEWFDKKLLEHQQGIRGLARKYGFAFADELEQEIYAYCLKNWASYRPEGGFWMWMRFVARGVSSNIRKQYRQKHARINKCISDFKDDGTIAVQGEQDDFAEFCDIMEHMPKGRMGDILMRRAMGDDLGAIGKDYGISRERIRQIEVKARAHLKRSLGNAYKDRFEAA